MKKSHRICKKEQLIFSNQYDNHVKRYRLLKTITWNTTFKFDELWWSAETSICVHKEPFLRKNEATTRFPSKFGSRKRYAILSSRFKNDFWSSDQVSVGQNSSEVTKYTYRHPPHYKCLVILHDATGQYNLIRIRPTLRVEMCAKVPLIRNTNQLHFTIKSGYFRSVQHQHRRIAI